VKNKINNDVHKHENERDYRRERDVETQSKQEIMNKQGITGARYGRKKKPA
jgi:hypothetical protein